ncbi:c-type cytochrome [Guyparkeria sp.]|uniref:c-type cytochrome n=1 Tax=Guyparkeria sp. TaxID=2035736 RepID=UPI0039705648
MKTAIHPMPRRGRFTAGMLIGLSFLTGAAQANEAGSIKAGREAAESCAACHGEKGNSNNPAFPSIAGQSAKYVASQLTAYRDGKRENDIMSGQASGLSDEQIRDIAVYYAAQERKVANPADDGSDLGADLYHQGRENVAACAACHHSEGHGNQPAGFPALRGLTAAYTAQSLKDYRSGDRSHGQAALMTALAAELSDDEIDALAAHIASLD